MKAFVSSVIGGFEEFRAAAAKAIQTIHSIPILSEEFGAAHTVRDAVERIWRSKWNQLEAGVSPGCLASRPWGRVSQKMRQRTSENRWRGAAGIQ